MLLCFRCHEGGDNVPDIKKSTYKKVSAFLKRYSAVGLLVVVEDAGVSSVVSVSRDHELLRALPDASRVEDPEGLRRRVLAASAGPSAGEEGSSAAATLERLSGRLKSAEGGSGAGKHKGLRVVELYRFTRPFRDLFGSVEGDFGDCLTATEVQYYAYVYHRTYI